MIVKTVSGSGVMLVAALALAGCGKPAPDATVTPAASPAGGTAAGHYVETVTALPEGQRRGVLFRAIVDAGHDCQSIVDSRREDAVKGQAAWSARCADGAVWLVALGDDGVAQVSQARPAR
jgi:hypothetical protein